MRSSPHNGYSNSFAALLERLDPYRFARGVEPDSQTVREVTVRRLKHEMVDEDRNPRFPKREIVALEVDYPRDERDVHADLRAYSTLRARRLSGEESSKLSADFVTTLLKAPLLVHVDGIAVDGPRLIAKVAKRRGSRNRDEVQRIATTIAQAFPPA